MPIYKITTKSRKLCNGILIEPGMEVEVVNTSFSNPVIANGGAEVEAAFMRKYGISLKNAGAMNTVYLDVKRK